MRRFFIILLLIVATVGIMAQPKRQMRAAWIATVVGIDWPSTTEDVTLQKQSMLAILDSLKALNFNAVVFQVRPTADAFYASNIEPWSRYLTGTQGVAPTPFYDPLEFVVREAHRRCMEVHVWLNPYRAILKGDISQLDSTHLYYSHPEWFVKYGELLLYNPALPETREHLNKVVADIVTRYDIDAVHFDDYFYPYRYKNQEFPDESDFLRDPRGFTDKGDWRRDNVNIVIAQLQKTIKSIKPWVEFGISPFGLWRNADKDERGSQTKGMTNYDDLYADILKWLEDGDIDYVTPQLYWEIGRPNLDFCHLAEWWAQYCNKSNYYVGVYASNLGNATAKPAWRQGNEIMRELRYLENVDSVQGVMFYSTVAIMQNRQNLRDSLHTYFTTPALVPTNDNLFSDQSSPVKRLRTHVVDGQTYLEWSIAREIGGCAPSYFVVYVFDDKENAEFDDVNNILTLSSDNCINLSNFANKLAGKRYVAVTCVNRYKRESEPTKLIKLPK